MTGLNEARDFTNEARRACAREELTWFCDPQLWKTALPGYRTSPQLQALDYTPGRDADPYTAQEFEELSFLTRVGRSVVGDQFDIGATGALAGSFVARAPDDPWLPISAEMVRVGIAQRDALGPRPIVAPLPLEMAAFADLSAQRRLLESVRRHQPDAYLLMLSGLHEGSGPERIVQALRLALLLQEIGAPVILSRTGTLRYLFLSFGVRGIEFGLGRLLRFSIPDYEKGGGRGGPPRFELPSLVGSLGPQQATAALAAELLPETECDCPSCLSSSSPRKKVARTPEHAAHTVCRQGESLDEVAPAERVEALSHSLRQASWRWEELRSAGIVDQIPPYLGQWGRAIDDAVKEGLLNPAELAQRVGVA